VSDVPAGNVESPMPAADEEPGAVGGPPVGPPDPSAGAAEPGPGADGADGAVVPADDGETGAGPEANGGPDGDGAPDGSPDRGPSPTADFSLALVSAVNVDLPNQHPTVILREIESPRRQLSFSIGLPDGVVLSHAMRRIPTPRPLTHELVSSILQGFAIDVVAVRLVGRQGSVYFAEIDLRGRNGRSVHSCRPSDGLTIALLQPVPVPILIDRRLFEQAGDIAPFGAAPG
jgi:bifunctional DNase/RNase